VRTSRLVSWRRGAVGLAVFVGFLELIPRVGLVSRTSLPPFSEMMKALAQEMGNGEFWSSVAATLQGWFIGLAIAMVLGVLLGMLIGGTPILREFTASTIEFLRPIPSVALIPLAILLYGTGIESTLLLVVYAAFWQVLIQVLYGVQDVDPVVRETAKSYRFRRVSIVRHVLWPTALPYIMTGLRLAATVALVLAITAELIIGSPGIGKLIATAQSGGAYALMYALVIVTGLLGVAVNLLARMAERRMLSWHPSVVTEIAG